MFTADHNKNINSELVVTSKSKKPSASNFTKMPNIAHAYSIPAKCPTVVTIVSLRNLGPILHHIDLDYWLPDQPQRLEDTADLLGKGNCNAFVSMIYIKSAWEGG